MSRPRKRQPRGWINIFITVLRRNGNVTAAAAAAGVTRNAAYEARRVNPAFALAWDEAHEQAVDSLEEEAFRRAREGATRNEPLMYQGQVVGYKTVTEYSDGLLTFLLKANRAKYRDKVDITIRDLRDRAEAAVEQMMTEAKVDRPTAIQLLAAQAPEIVELVSTANN